MKQPRTICLACRFKLLARHQVPLRPATWTQPLSSSARLSTSAVEDTEATPTRNDDLLEPIDVPPRSSWPNKPSTPAPRRPTRGFGHGSGAGALALFQSVVDKQAKETDTHAQKDANVSTAPANLNLYKDVATLEEMLAKPSVSTVECFRYFQARIYSRIIPPNAQVPRVIRDRVGKELMARVSRERAANFNSRELPSVTQISQILLELGLLEPNAWAVMTTQLLEHICAISTSPGEYTTIESYETAMARRDTLIHDLVGAWRMFNVPPYVAARPGNIVKAASEARLPSLDKRKLAKYQKKGKMHLSVASLFPHYVPRQLSTVIPAAIATYVLLVDPINRASRVFRQEIAPFVDAMAAALVGSPPKRQELGSLYGQNPALLKYMTESWSEVQKRLQEQYRFADMRDPLEEDQQQAPNKRHAKQIHYQLGQAWNTKNLTVLERTWDEFWGTSETTTEKKLKKYHDNAELFNYFIMAYMGMRRPSRAIEVWDCMVNVGIKPTIKSWNSMIEGCKKAANLPGLKNVWAKLIASRIRLDTGIWTARISGLIELGDPEGGIAALEEMAQIWKADGGSGKDPAAVRPSIGPVNAALAGLYRLDRLSGGVASKLLSWAAGQGIEPDIYTFNTLLTPLLRQGLDEQVQNIFKMMKMQNIPPDVATFTILLEGALDDIGEQKPADQIKTVETFLRSMRDAGVTANMMLYAKMIHLLFRQGDRAEAPVKAVLADIWGRGLELSSHIYTMLAEHYFTRDPPDAGAVTALIENRRLHESKAIDWVFWDRVIFGYCQVGDMDRALPIFDRIDKSGAKVTFSTLYELLLLMGRSGRMEEVEKVIRFARRSKEQIEGVDTMRFWQHRFWHLAEEYGFPTEHLRAEMHGGGPV